MTKLEPYTGLAGEQVGPPGKGRPHMDKVEIRKRQRVWRRSRSSILLLSVATVACLTAWPAHGEPPDRRTDAEAAVVEKIRMNSRADETLRKGATAFEVALYANNEVVSAEEGDSCHGPTGTRSYSGTYWLVSIAKGKVVARTKLTQRLEFSEATEGMFTLSVANPDGALVVISQYASCNGTDYYFYRVDDAGRFYQVMILGANTDADPGLMRRRSKSIFGHGIGEESLQVASSVGQATRWRDVISVRYYNNAPGKGFKEWFAYDGRLLRLKQSQECTAETPC